METKDKYKEVKSALKAKRERGDVKSIAATVKKSAVYVSNVLNPTCSSYNEEIISEAVKLVTARERLTDRMLKKLGE